MYFNKFKKIPYEVNGDGIKRDLVNLSSFTGITTKLIDDIAFYSNYVIKDGERPDNVAYDIYDDASLYWTLFLVNPKLNSIYTDWPRSSSEILEYTKSIYPTYTGIVTFNDSLVNKFNIGEVVTGQLSGAMGTILAKNINDGHITIDVISGTFKVDGEAIRGVTSEDSVSTDAVVESAYSAKYYTDNSTGDRVPRRSAGTSPYTQYDYESDYNLQKSSIRVIKKEFIHEVVREFNREMRAK
tara:strand:+ start:793 stop:1515 length:723 start_codon:yes stop_codon:yes gene_type:complete